MTKDIANRVADGYGLYTPDHVKLHQPRIERDRGEVTVLMESDRAVPSVITRKLNEFAGRDDWALFVDVEWQGVSENSLETGYDTDYEVSRYRITDAWLDFGRNQETMKVPQSMWHELDTGALEEALDENYDGGDMPREIAAKDRMNNVKVARELVSVANVLSDPVTAFNTIEDKVTLGKIRRYLLDISDFVFRHRTTKPTTMVEIEGKEIEDLKVSVQRALDLT